MAEMANSVLEHVITFNISNDSLIEDSNILTENLTTDEQQEIHNIVTALEGVNSRELIDFTLQEPTAAAIANPRHKAVTSEELDRLASKNSAENTQYQTKWAVAVMKGAQIEPKINYLSYFLLRY